MIGWFQDEPVEQPKDWIRQSVRATETVFVRWESLERSVIVINARDEKILKVQTQRAHLDKAFFLRLVATESVRVLVASWESFQDAARLMGHMTHLGWGCFFKGAGHDHFASPRWLEHGPWLLERHGDVTYVQLYDLALEGDAAWQQGQHAMVRLSEGFFSKFGYTEVQTFGSYDLPSRSFTIVRTDQGVSQMDLWDYCLVRAMCRDDEAEPIEHIRVVFTEERDARRHLHELWLRGIECWALLADGRRVRLDLDYQPPARILPEWVEQHLGLPPSGPYAAAVPLSGPAPAPATGTRSSGVRLSLGLSSLLGPLTTEERRQLLAALVRYRPKVGLRDVPARADGADASAAFAGLVDEGEPWNADLPLAATQAALEATEFVVDVFLPLELIGLSVPSILVPHEFPSQAPLRATDLGAAALGAKLAGAVVLPVDDVLARVCALNRQDLRCAEQLLTLCGKHRLIVVARSPANG
ncbi:MAG: hypothetical protein MUF00_19485 [Gemmatimonadaceae bacterium]|jgi:hypothetical protein|nr:hypothetical protein [Gemmatimonadaceae bacterium]